MAQAHTDILPDAVEYRGYSLQVIYATCAQGKEEPSSRKRKAKRIQVRSRD
jgi:hypothetical protein